MTTPGTPHSDAQDRADLLAARLEALLAETGSLVDQLEAVGDQQHHAIESGQVRQIVEIVETREPLVRSLVRVGEELNAFIYEHTMKRLRERDAQDQQCMEQARDQIASQLAGMGSGKHALRAYSTRSQTPNPIMQDRRG